MRVFLYLLGIAVLFAVLIVAGCIKVARREERYAQEQERRRKLRELYGETQDRKEDA